MNELLKLNNIKFVPEKTFDWLPNKRYDFYIPLEEVIIEVHGLQHYNGGWGESKEDVEYNDNFKMTEALKNGIKKYIIIDARRSEFKYIIDRIKESEIMEYIDCDESFIQQLKKVN